MHPLDPLTPDEISIAAKTCKQRAQSLGESPLRFNAITLQVRFIVNSLCLDYVSLK